MNLHTKIIGNGDILSRQQGNQLIEQHRLDGVMIGRGIFRNPWLFAEDNINDDAQARFSLFAEHIDNFEQAWGKDKNPATLKKFAKMYINGFEGASQVREELMGAKTLQELQTVILHKITIQETE